VRVHFLRTGDDGAHYRAYANDGIPLPADATGAVEGQPVCRRWQARLVFSSRSRTTENYQYTDTSAGTYWCLSQTGSTPTGGFPITLGVPYVHARWIRGRDTTSRATSHCPDESCCRRPDADLASRWREQSWPSATLHAHVLACPPRAPSPVSTTRRSTPSCRPTPTKSRDEPARAGAAQRPALSRGRPRTVLARGRLVVGA
jgi:hypothetical protein